MSSNQTGHQSSVCSTKILIAALAFAVCAFFFTLGRFVAPSSNGGEGQLRAACVSKIHGCMSDQTLILHRDPNVGGFVRFREPVVPVGPAAGLQVPSVAGSAVRDKAEPAPSAAAKPPPPPPPPSPPAAPRNTAKASDICVVMYMCARQGAGCAKVDWSKVATAARARRLTGRYDGAVPHFALLSVRNKAAYAALHGYTFLLSEELYATDRGLAWGKLQAISGALERCKAALFVDVDTVITNPDIGIEHRLGAPQAPPAGDALRSAGSGAPAVNDIVLARDWNDLNTGVMIVQSTPWARQWFKERWDNASPEGKTHPWSEQFDIQNWAKAHSGDAAQHLSVIPQKQLQSYPKYTPGIGPHAASHGWSEGDWMIHFAGCGDQAGRSCEQEFVNQWKASGERLTIAAEDEAKTQGPRAFVPPPGWKSLEPGKAPSSLERVVSWVKSLVS